MTDIATNTEDTNEDTNAGNLSNNGAPLLDDGSGSPFRPPPALRQLTRPDGLS